VLLQSGCFGFFIFWSERFSGKRIVSFPLRQAKFRVYDLNSCSVQCLGCFAADKFRSRWSEQLIAILALQPFLLSAALLLLLSVGFLHMCVQCLTDWLEVRQMATERKWRSQQRTK